MPRAVIPPTAFTAWGPERRWWILNPGPRLDICFDEGITDFVFAQRTYQFKSNMAISPRKSIEVAARGRPWRAMLIEYAGTCGIEFDSEHGWNHPVGAYPAWSASEDPEVLRRILRRYPRTGVVGRFLGSETDIRAVPEQERVVLVTNLPNDNWEDFFRMMIGMKRDHPDIIFHFHGSKSMTRTLGTGVDSFDHPVTQRWENGIPSLLLPNGKEYRRAQARDHVEEEHPDKWSALIGMKASTVAKIHNRDNLSRTMYRFNLRSMKWAFANYDKFWSLRVVDESAVDADSPDTEWIPIELRYRPRRRDVGDQWACDVCSLYTSCPYSRPGAICVVPDTPGREIAELYGTRDMTNVEEVLKQLLQIDATRLERGLKKEEEDMRNGKSTINRKGENVLVDVGLDPEVTKLSDSIFNKTMQLLKLTDPTAAARMAGKAPPVMPISATSQDPAQLAQAMQTKAIEMGFNPASLTDEQASKVLSSLHGGEAASFPADDRHDDDGEDVSA